MKTKKSIDRQTTLSLILPTYNEKENIKIYIPILHKLLSDENIDFEIIVVDDFSPDGTASVAEAMPFPNLKVIRRIGEKGLSSAILFGFLQAKGEYTCVIDSDMQHDESIIPEMLGRAQKEGLDLVVGSRKVGDYKYGDMPGYRKWISKIADRIANWIIPIPVQDSMSGFFLARTDHITRNIDSLNPRGFKILLEIACRIPNLKILELPYQFRKRIHGKTKLSSLVIIEYLFSLLEIRFLVKFSPAFVKYSIVGSLGILVNLFFQFFFDLVLPNQRLFFPENPYIKPTISVILGFEFSLIHNFIWNHNWTFQDREKYWFPALLKFHFVSLFGFLIQIATWFYIYSVWIQSWDFLQGYATNLSNLIGIMFAFVSNYFLNKNITWKKSQN